ncbi:unnamed protein product [Polarella glacialis]|uniref:Uncharacterized protein n=1 Tax=Polarella glacialis TaxID=89957 RepID=A0A813F0L3_POLGL|nr:unnamed protein product [Polarella glacialis]
MSHVLPYQIEGNVYLSSLQIPSAFNSSDDPTRDKPLRKPTIEKPYWLSSFQAGAFDAFDEIRSADMFRGALSLWARLVLKLGRAKKLWVPTFFDSTKGYPGEGPRPRKTTQHSRADIDLAPTARLASRTSDTRTMLFLQLESCFFIHLSASVDLLSRSGLVLATALVAYGRHMFYASKPLYLFTETLNSDVDRFRYLKTYFSECWALISRWEDVEPTERKMILPEPCICAMVSLALALSWPRFAAAMLLGFHGVLRIKELLSLTRADIILPADLLSEQCLAFCRVRDPKNQAHHEKAACSYVRRAYGAVPACCIFSSCA